MRVNLSEFIEQVDAVYSVQPPIIIDKTENLIIDGENVDRVFEQADEQTGVAAEALSDCIDIYSCFYQNTDKGISQPAAKIAFIALESIKQRLGIKVETTMPALEHFGSDHTMQAATRISLETLTETIQKLLKMFLEFLDKTFTKLKAFFSGLKAKWSKEKNDKFVNETKAKIKEIKSTSGGEKAANEKIAGKLCVSKVVNETFYMEGVTRNVKSVNAVIDNINVLGIVLADVSNACASALKEMSININNFIFAAQDKEFSDSHSYYNRIKDVYETLNTDLKRIFIRIQDSKFYMPNIPKDVKEFYNSIALAGNVRLLVYISPDNNYSDILKAGFQIAVDNEEWHIPLELADTVDVMHLADKLGHLNLFKYEIQTKCEKISETFRSVLYQANKLEKISRDIENPVMTESIQLIVKIVRSIIRNHNNIIPQGLTLMGITSTNCNRYITESIEEFKY